MMMCLLAFGLGAAASAYYNVFAVFWVSAVLLVFYAVITIGTTGGLQVADLGAVGLAALFQVGYLVGGVALSIVPPRHVVPSR